MPPPVWSGPLGMHEPVVYVMGASRETLPSLLLLDLRGNSGEVKMFGQFFLLERDLGRTRS